MVQPSLNRTLPVDGRIGKPLELPQLRMVLYLLYLHGAVPAAQKHCKCVVCVVQYANFCFKHPPC